jgi:general transcription factor 3C polypeptide 5 (transcription factor C subunit 1)
MYRVASPQSSRRNWSRLLILSHLFLPCLPQRDCKTTKFCLFEHHLIKILTLSFLTSKMVSETSNADRTNERAPKYLVPDQIAMTVEHPCIIKNFDKAYSMMGGPPAIARSFKAGPGPEAALNLRFEPDDPTDRPIASMPRSANNILLAVTVPKRTGRKRKRGSDGPFLENLNDQPPAKDAQYLLRSLQDNPNSYSLEPLANISSTHVWRTMPDFVYSTAHSEFINELREKVLPMSYPLMKQYTLPQTYGLTNTEVIPPPQLSSARIPTNYSYRSNPYMPLRTSPTTNHQTLYHRTAARKTQLISVHWNSPLPTTPRPPPPPPRPR